MKPSCRQPVCVHCANRYSLAVSQNLLPASHVCTNVIVLNIPEFHNDHKSPSTPRCISIKHQTTVWGISFRKQTTFMISISAVAFQLHKSPKVPLFVDTHRLEKLASALNVIDIHLLLFPSLYFACQHNTFAAFQRGGVYMHI